jgi:hypothetical protein
MRELQIKIKTMVDYKILEHGDEIYLEEINDNEKETKQEEPETKELTLIKSKKDDGEDQIEADVIVTYFFNKRGAKVPGYLEIKEYTKDGKVVYYSINAIIAISKSVNRRLGPILSHLGISKECNYYNEIYKIIKSIIYGDYIITELYKNNYIIYIDPDSVGDFYYTIYKELLYGKLPKEEYIEVTQINKINPYVGKDLTLYSNIVDRLKQKMEIKAIKR